MTHSTNLKNLKTFHVNFFLYKDVSKKNFKVKVNSKITLFFEIKLKVVNNVIG